MSVARQSSLQQVGGYPFPVLCSSGAIEQARGYAARLAAAHRFLNDALEFTPQLRLLTLAPDDWKEHAGFPMYGMPHTARESDIVVGTELASFWEPIIRIIEETSTPEEHAELLRIHAPADGKLNASALNDLLPVHELGHLYHQQVPFSFPRLWMMELYANLCVHTYLDALEPDKMLAWTSLCERMAAVPAVQMAHHSLTDFERLYVGVGADNYVWYQFRFVAGIMAIFEPGDTGLLQRLYQFGKTTPGDMSDGQLAKLLGEQVHPGLAEMWRSWPE